MRNTAQITLVKRDGKIFANVWPQTNKKKSTNRPSSTNRKKVRILSIDGGGIRGIIPATILAHLEERIQQKTGNLDARIADYFELIAGTSTGGILACFYLIPDPQNPNRPKLTAKEALEIYLNFGKDVFTQSIWRKLKEKMGFVKEKYSARPMDKTLKEKYGESIQLSDLIKPCLLTSYDMTKESPVVFNSLEAKNNAAKDFKIWELGRATSAAPGLFKPMALKPMTGRSQSFIDGSIFAQSPAMCAYNAAQETCFSKAGNQEAMPDNPTAEDIVMVSIGTGKVKSSGCLNKSNQKIDLAWIKSIIGLMRSGSAKRVDAKLKKIFQSPEGEQGGRYFRFAPDLYEASPDLDNVEPKNMKALHQAGLQFVEDHADELENLVDTLIQQG